MADCPSSEAGFSCFKPMNRQFKSLPYFEVKAESTGRVRKGICAVFGNVDSWGDRIMPGAFAKTIMEGRARVKHLWNHDFSTPPIASITELKEVGRDELPEAVLEYAPEATGGLMVAREYYDTELSNWVFEAVTKGDVSEMSFGYDVIKSAESDENDTKVRNLVELKLFDTSDVLWGMNAATVASGAKSAMPLGVLVSQLTNIAEEVKAGRRNAGSDESLIDAIHQAAFDLGCTKCLGIKEDEAKSDEAEAAQQSTSLDFLKLKTRGLALSVSNQL